MNTDHADALNRLEEEVAYATARAETAGLTNAEIEAELRRVAKELENDNWPTKDETISTVADLIKQTVFNAGWEDTSTDELCRQAAIAIINHLAGVYDEAMKNEPPDAG